MANKKWADLTGLDLEWFCSDLDEHVGVFFTAGPGLIPVPVINDLEFDRELRNLLNENYHYEKLGIWTYDWNDVHKVILHRTYQYQRIGLPDKPAQIDQFAEPFRATLRKRKIRSRFADLASIPIQRFFSCEKPLIEVQQEMIQQLRYSSGQLMALACVFRGYNHLENICHNSCFTVFFSQQADVGKIVTSNGHLSSSDYPGLHVVDFRDPAHALELVTQLLDDIHRHLLPYDRNAGGPALIPPLKAYGKTISFVPNKDNQPFTFSAVGSPEWLSSDRDIEVPLLNQFS